MKISAIRVYQVDLPLVEGRYSWSEGKFVEVFDSTVVELLTDDGNVGYGEVCPLGPFYLPAFGAGARAGIAELAATIIGQDPTAIGPINQLMDRALLGHPYVKSAIDMACWDILGKAANMPICHLLGGRYGEDVVLYRAISQRPAAEMAANVASYRSQGYRRFQLKVGGHANEDIERIRAVREILEAAADVSSEEERQLCRLAELVYFCLEMRFRKIGIAYCVDLQEPAEILAGVLDRSFKTVGVCCRLGTVPQRRDALISPINCNPLAQARFLNQAGTDLNVIVGLCVGADCVFAKESDAPVTTLFVKDKSLANNPIGAVYSEYYLRESAGRSTDDVPGQEDRS